MNGQPENAVPDQAVLPHSGEAVPAEGIDLLAITAALLQEWRLGVAVWLVTAALCTLFTFLSQSQYVAVASILPESDRAHSESIADFFSAHSPGGMFIGLLKSRSVADDIIDRLHLLDQFKTKSRATARDMLADKSSFVVGTDSLLTISVKDKSAQNAAAIANGYLSALEALNQTMTREQSRQIRSFYEEQLGQERDDLVRAETQLEQTEKTTGLIAPETQTQIGLNSIASTRAQITNLQVQLAALLQSDTEQNPQVQRLRSQIAQLKEQENAEEQGGKLPPGAAPAAGQLPQTNLDYTRAQREVKYHDTLVNALVDRFEAARLGEGTSRPAFQVIDSAIAPEYKSWPPRKLFVIIGFLIGAVAGLAAVIAKLIVRRVLADPGNRPSLEAIRGVFGAR